MAATNFLVDGGSFRRGDLDGIIDFTSDGAIDRRERRIRCPRCRWQPRKADRWQCMCSHLWHLFDTRGRCPACSHQWHAAQCLRCAEWSASSAWYG